MASISTTRRGLRLSLAALVAALLLAVAAGVVPVGAGGNSDAAHACQQGGYMALKGTDGTLFQNAGACVSFVARGGTITGVAPDCVYTAGTSGCVEFDRLRMYLGTPNSTVWTDLSGMFDFSPATGFWAFDTAITVTGSGTWTTSAGTSGFWTAVSMYPYYQTSFYNSGTSSFGPCTSADIRYVGVRLNLAGTTLNSGAVIDLGLRSATTGNNGVIYQGYGLPQGEPFGLHYSAQAPNGGAVPGMILRC